MGLQKKRLAGDSLVSMTRPGYETFSHSSSVVNELSTPFSASGVAVERAGPEGWVNGFPLGLDREARVGLGSPWLLTGRMPGDDGLVRESSYGYEVSIRIPTVRNSGPDLCLQNLLRELQRL
jgi:hypothetical protein